MASKIDGRSAPPPQMPHLTGIASHDFRGQPIRILTITGSDTVWFVAAEVARVVGYPQTQGITQNVYLQPPEFLFLADQRGVVQKTRLLSAGDIRLFAARSYYQPVAGEFGQWALSLRRPTDVQPFRRRRFIGPVADIRPPEPVGKANAAVNLPIKRRADIPAVTALTVHGFEGCPVRVVMLPGSNLAWFAMTDVAKAIGYPPTHSLTQLAGLGPRQHADIPDRVRLFSADDIQLLATKSMRPVARQFERWALGLRTPTEA